MAPSLPLLSNEAIDDLLRTSRRIAVLGIKPEEKKHRSAHNIPAYLADVGYQIIPVPVYYPEVREILSVPVVRSLRDITGPVDILNIFRKPEHLDQHVQDILALGPSVVWFQSGLLHLPSAEKFAQAGIGLVHDCIGCRRAAIAPSWRPLPGQDKSAKPH